MLREHDNSIIQGEHRSVSPLDTGWSSRAAEKTKRTRVALQNGIGYGRAFIIMSQKWFLDIYEIRFDIQMCVPLVHGWE